MRFIVASLLVAAVAGSGCPNQCSGHGQCNSNDACLCEKGWVGNDCRERACAFGLSWISSTNTDNAPAGTIQVSGTTQKAQNQREGIGGRHDYAECSDKGKCDRSSGECACFEGYEGKGCRRQTCPSDCSGHGRCVYNQKLNPNYSGQGFAVNTANPYNPSHTVEFDSQYWDRAKTRSCVCDRGWEGTDCADRTCPKGDDPITDCNLSSKAHAADVQVISFADHAEVFKTDGTNAPGFFTLQFTDMFGANFTTRPIAVSPDAATSASADGQKRFAADIEEALESLPNFAIPNATVTVAAVNSQLQFSVTFVDAANSGLQNLLQCSYASPVNKQISDVDAENPSNFGASQPRFFSPYSADATDAAKARICKVTHSSATLTKAGDDEIKENVECSNRGMCDHGSGTCSCFSGFSGEACSAQTVFF